MNNTIPNIDKTAKNGIEYAYEKEGKFDTLYVAECVEYGEVFTSDFYAPSNYTVAQLMEIGNDIASIYGGSCTDVFKQETV